MVTSRPAHSPQCVDPPAPARLGDLCVRRRSVTKEMLLGWWQLEMDTQHKRTWGGVSVTAWHHVTTSAASIINAVAVWLAEICIALTSHLDNVSGTIYSSWITSMSPCSRYLPHDQPRFINSLSAFVRCRYSMSNFCISNLDSKFSGELTTAVTVTVYQTHTAPRPSCDFTSPW